MKFLNGLMSLFLLVAIVYPSSPTKIHAASGGHFNLSAQNTSNHEDSLEALASFRLRVRDSVSGIGIATQIAPTGNRISTAASNSLHVTDKFGFADLAYPQGFHTVEFFAPGYHPIRSHFSIGADGIDVMVWLDRIEPYASAGMAKPARSAFMYGNVFDERGRPVKSARVGVANAASTVTDRNGYFELVAPVKRLNGPDDVPGPAIVEVRVAGAVLYRKTGDLLAEGVKRMIIDISRGQLKLDDEPHKINLEPEQAAESQSIDAGPAPGGYSLSAMASSPASVTVPASIRVGSNCPTRHTCSVFNVFSLDTYVRFGLDDEWIASWNTNSLKAGAIAFRSYGVYHVFNPLNANYDICNTTSCQVVDPSDSYAATDTATAHTTGSIVVNASGTGPFFAEYSAENNNGNGACPDGFTGNNTSWPCIADPVDAGQTFNGHGRGMCQWGTQRWSINQGKDFVWIVNHYYNNNGSPAGFRTGILQSSPNSVLPPPVLVQPTGQAAPGSQVSTLTPTLTWQPVNGADGYSLYIGRLIGATYTLVFNSETALGQPITGTSYVIPAGILEANGQYRWHMAAHNAGGYGSANTFRNYFFVSLADLSVSGQVTGPDGRAVRNASVSIVDNQGLVRRTVTSSFGYFVFDGLSQGTYTVSAASRRYRFSAQTISVTQNVTDLTFVGLE